MNTPPARSSLALRRIPLFEGLGEACLDRLAQQCDWHQLAARKPLLSRAAEGGDVFFLIAGRLRITTYSASGRQVTFRDCEPGEHIGVIAAIDGGPRSADVVAVDDTLVASLSREGFLALLRDEPLVAQRVMHYLATLVRQLSDRVIDLSTLGVHHRLHAELLRLTRLAGVEANQARIEPAPAHADLASRISTNREQVTRELGALVKAGVLQKDGRALVVVDAQRLERMVAEMRGE